MTNDLLPCPFNHKHELERYITGDGTMVSCCSCGIEMHVDQWNTRATGKGGGEPYRTRHPGAIDELDDEVLDRIAALKQPAAPTQIDAGELEKAIADLQSRLNISSEITINEGMPMKVNGLSQLSAERLLQAARALLEKSKGGV